MPYVTAQHVRSHQSEGEAVHAFLHDASHIDWNTPPEAILRMIDQDAGTLLDSDVSPLRQGGNEVLSYLDVLAPEGIHRSAMIEVLDELYGVEAQEGPIVLVVRNLIVRLSVRPDRLQDWPNEISELSSKIEGLLRKATRLRSGRPSSQQR